MSAWKGLVSLPCTVVFNLTTPEVPPKLFTVDCTLSFGTRRTIPALYTVILGYLKIPDINIILFRRDPTRPHTYVLGAAVMTFFSEEVLRIWEES